RDGRRADSLRNLAAKGGRGLGARPVPGAIRSIRIAEAADTHVEPVIARVGEVKILAEQLLLRERKCIETGVGLLERHKRIGQAFGRKRIKANVGINALARSKENPGVRIDLAHGVKGVEIDLHGTRKYISVVMASADITNPAH